MPLRVYEDVTSKITAALLSFVSSALSSLFKKSLKQKFSSWFWVSLHEGQCKKNQHGILLVSFYQQSFQILEMSHDNVVDRSSVSFQLILTPTVHTISMSKFNLDNGRALHKESMGTFVNTESQALSLI